MNLKLHPPIPFYYYLPIVLVSTGLNLIFSWFNNVIIKSPIFLDSIFTAVGAAIYGPATGIFIGLFTNLAMEPLYGMSGVYWPFAICNISTGLIVGIASARGWFRKSSRITLLIILVTFINAFLGSIIAYFVFDGNTGVQIDVIISAFVETGRSLFTSVFWARIPTNLIDKMITVYIAFGIYRVMEYSK